MLIGGIWVSIKDEKAAKQPPLQIIKIAEAPQGIFDGHNNLQFPVGYYTQLVGYYTQWVGIIPSTMGIILFDEYSQNLSLGRKKRSKQAFVCVYRGVSCLLRLFFLFFFRCVCSSASEFKVTVDKCFARYDFATCHIRHQCDCKIKRCTCASSFEALGSAAVASIAVYNSVELPDTGAVLGLNNMQSKR